MENKEGKLLDSFWSLSSLKEQERLKASLLILKYVRNDKENKETAFILERLIRGVASSRAGAYRGFFPCLTSLLQISDVSTTSVWKLIKKTYPVNDESLKKCEGEQLVGMILSIGALVRVCCDRMNEEQLKNAFCTLLRTRNVKTFLGPMALVFLLHILDNATEEVFENALWPVLGDVLDVGLGDLSPEDLAMLLKAEHKFHGIMKARVKKQTGSKKILSSANVESLTPVVLKTRNCLPSCHPLLNILGETIVGKSHLPSFWDTCVNEELVNNHDKGKGQVAFFLAAAALKHADNSDQVSIILSKPVIGEYVYHANHLGSKELAIVKFTQALSTVLDHEDSDVKIAGLQAILTPPGSILIDSVTRSRLVARVVCNNDSGDEVIRFLTDECHSIILGANPEHLPSHKKHAAQLLARLALHPSMQNDLEWQARQLCLLMTLGMFHVTGATTYLESPPKDFPDSVRPILRDSFTRASDHPGLSFSSQCTIMWKVVQEANELLNSKQAKLVVCKFDDETKKHWRAVVKLIPKLNKEMGSVFRLLFLHILIQMLTNPQDTLPTLKDLMACYERATKSENEEDLPWVEVVTDLLLSLISSKRHVMRTVAKQTFKMLVPYTTLPAILSVLEAIHPASEPLAEAKDEEMESDEESEEEMEVDSDESEDNSEDQSESDEEEDEDPVANGDVDPKFLESVEKALGPAAVTEDSEDVDLTDIDDDTAKEIDSALAAVFRQRGGKVNKDDKKKKAQNTQIMHFRIRCVELLETYVKTGPKLSIVVEIIPGLFNALELTCRDSKLEPLQNKLTGAIRVLAQTTKTEVDDASSVPDVLNDLNKRAHKLFGERTLELVTKCSTYLTRCAINSKKKKVRSKVKEAHLNAFKSLFERGSCPLRLSYFKEVLSLPWAEAWQLSEMLVEYAFKEGLRGFKRKHALTLLRELFVNQGLNELVEREAVAQQVLNLSTEALENMTQKGKADSEFLLIAMIELCISCCSNHSLESLPLLQALVKLQTQKVCKKTSLKRIRRAYAKLFKLEKMTEKDVMKSLKT